MKNYLYFLLSMIIFGAVGIFAKYIQLSAGQIAFSLSSIGSLSLLTILLWKRTPMDWHKIRQNFRLLLAASISLSGNWIFLFQAYKHTSIANAALSYYLAPVFVILAAPFALGETFSLRKLFCAIIALLGLFLVLQQSSNTAGNDVSGILYGFAAAAFYAALTLLNKFIQGLDNLLNTFLQLSISSILLAMYLFLTTDFAPALPSPTDTGLLLILGFFHGGIGFYLFFTSMKGLSGQSIAILSYADPLTSLLIAATFIGEAMSCQQLLGICLLFGAIWFAEQPQEKIPCSFRIINQRYRK